MWVSGSWGMMGIRNTRPNSANRHLNRRGTETSGRGKEYRYAYNTPALHLKNLTLFRDHLGRRDPSESSNGSDVYPPLRDGRDRTQLAASRSENALLRLPNGERSRQRHPRPSA